MVEVVDAEDPDAPGANGFVAVSLEPPLTEHDASTTASTAALVAIASRVRLVARIT